MDEILKLNVGGTVMMVKKSILQAFPNGVLCRLFEKNFKLEMVDDAYFIDSDPELFRHILNFHRHRLIPTDLSEELKREVEIWFPGQLVYENDDKAQLIAEKLHQYFMSEIQNDSKFANSGYFFISSYVNRLFLSGKTKLDCQTYS
jgi:hypothetical protein